MAKPLSFRMAFLIALTLGVILPAAPMLAQGEGQTGALSPFASAIFRISGVAPAGWPEVSPGVYARQATPTDRTVLVQQAQNTSRAQLTAGLLRSLGLQELPERVGVHESAAFTWDLYTLEIETSDQALVIDMALAETETATYLIVLQTVPDEHDALRETVFMPAVDALDVLSWGRETDSPAGAGEEEIMHLVPEIIAVRPHDVSAYTQGLLLYEGSLYESAGRYAESTLREVDPETGEVLRMVEVPDEYFAEGLERVGDRLVQLTWKEKVAFIYDLETFEQVGAFTYEGEGWGLCYDDEYLYMSDGSPIISIRDPETFEVMFRGVVTYQGSPVQNLNELECVGDYIYANVWNTDYIMKIDKTNGRVVAFVDAAGLLTPEDIESLASGSVLNGIAYNAEADTFLITGKRWPKLFEVRFVEHE